MMRDTRATAQAMFADASAHQRAGRLDDAVAGYEMTLMSEPSFPEAHNNLGNALRGQGQPHRAIDCFRRALDLRPDFAGAHYNLGSIYMDQGQLDLSVSCFRRALQFEPDFLEAHYNLANALVGLKQLEEACGCYRRAIDLRPDYPEAHNNLGNALLAQERLDEAVACFRKAIDLRPGYPEAHSNLGNALREQGQLDAAVACCQRAIALKPALLQAHSNLGAALMRQGRLDEAALCYHEALARKPDYLEAHVNLGNILWEQGRLDDAATCYRRAIALKPDYPAAHHGLGNALLLKRDFVEAAICYRNAIGFKPDYPEAHNNLGNALKEQGLLDEALVQYSMAIKLKPDYFAACSNRLFTHNYLVRQPPQVLRDMARQFGTLVSSHASRPFSRWRERPPGIPLRVGLVSSDLRLHPVGHFLEALLGAVDPARVEFLAFPSHHREDELTARIKPFFRNWKPIHALGDEAAAQCIHDEGVQLLIDLSGHTAHNRLPMFAWRPAPVQAGWLGYFATTGVSEIDYILADPTVAPPEEADHFTETIWSLPETYYCFTPPAFELEASSLPALSNGHVTFGCFNNLTKVNDAVIAVWARVLQAVPGSRLMLKAPQLRDETVRSSIRSRFAAHGIPDDRLQIEPASPRGKYLRAYHRIDIALDPFPYPGGTTSFEALWMGLPVLTRRGDRFLSHAGETIARNAGLTDWIAQDDDDYVAKAVGFASDLSYLASLRTKLRAQVLASPLFDAPRFARNFEAAVEGMWQRQAAQS